jgi:hypothetical protein
MYNVEKSALFTELRQEECAVVSGGSAADVVRDIAFQRALYVSSPTGGTGGGGTGGGGTGGGTGANPGLPFTILFPGIAAQTIK